MQCPQCGFNVNDTDTFCEKCGVVFADYNQIQIQKKQAIPETKNIPDPQVTVQQQELTAKFLCNSEGCVITNHSVRKDKIVSKQMSANDINLGEEKDFSNSLVKILVAITILAVIFFVYFFVII